MSIALSKEKVKARTGLTIFYSYITLFITNAVTISLANYLFPTEIVLGTYALTPSWSLYLAVVELTVVCTMIFPLVYYHEYRRGSEYTAKEWMMLYFAVNTITIWSIARFADKIGFGISSWYIAIILGIILQWMQSKGMLLIRKITTYLI